MQTDDTTDLQSLLGLTEEDLAALPEADRAAAMELLVEAQKLSEEAERERQRRVEALGREVLSRYSQRVTQRQVIEQRWLKDIRRFNGEYEADVKAALESRVFGSRAFVPLARRVINIVYSRFIDLAFPTDERAFVVKHTPMPQLTRAETLAKRMEPGDQVPMPGGETVMAQAVAASVRELREEAAEKAAAMQREIDDQLQQANWPRVGRNVIREALTLGTGVIKGPIVLNRRKKVWDMSTGRPVLTMAEDSSPTVEEVPAWDFFPDMSARRLKDSTSEIQRHYLNASQLAKMAEQPGFNQEAIRRLLKTPPGHVRDAVADQLRNSAGTSGIPDPRYLILEEHGPVSVELLQDMGVEVPDDPLIVYESIVYVAEDGTVLKAVIEPMDTQERPFSVYCWEEDPGSIFGFGLSHECADMVDACNSSFRAAMDNLGLGVGPMLVVNDKLIEPQNGRWVIEPNKIWRMKRADGDARQAFAFFQIDSKLEQLLGVFDRSKALIDDVAGPVMAMQGQEAPSYLDTARGASIAWNAANVWMRRAIRDWDDDVVYPLVSRFIDWNMQFSDKTDIHGGDLMAQARGYSGLLEAEGQSYKVQGFLKSLEGMPMPYKRRVAQAKAFARALRLPDEDLLPDEAEVDQIAAQVDNQGPPPNPELERIKMRQMELQDAQTQRQHERELAVMSHQARLAEVASKEGLTAEQARQRYGLEVWKLQAGLQDKREARAADAQALNAEISLKAAMGSGV